MERGLLALRLVVASGGEGSARLLSVSSKGCGGAMRWGPLLLQHRLFCGCSGRLHQKQQFVTKSAIPKDIPKPVPGIPYNKLSVGVPKEIWKNERRWVPSYKVGMYIYWWERHWLSETVHRRFCMFVCVLDGSCFALSQLK
jgi:hypothetical protein